MLDFKVLDLEVPLELLEVFLFPIYAVALFFLSRDEYPMAIFRGPLKLLELLLVQRLFLVLQFDAIVCDIDAHPFLMLVLLGLDKELLLLDKTLPFQ